MVCAHGEKDRVIDAMWSIELTRAHTCFHCISPKPPGSQIHAPKVLPHSNWFVKSNNADAMLRQLHVPGGLPLMMRRSQPMKTTPSRPALIGNSKLPNCLSHASTSILAALELSGSRRECRGGGGVIREFKRNQSKKASVSCILPCATLGKIIRTCDLSHQPPATLPASLGPITATC